MDLPSWTLQEVSKAGSLNKLAKVIGLSRQTLMDWRDAKASFLTDKGANAIARYLGLNKPPEQIREMFGMPAHPYLTIGEVTPEKNNDDLVDVLQGRVAKLEEDNQFFREEIDDLRELIDTLAKEMHERTKPRKVKV
jgi:transcriptional regulator with XRE-family HTH domain